MENFNLSILRLNKWRSNFPIKKYVLIMSLSSAMLRELI